MIWFKKHFFPLLLIIFILNFYLPFIIHRALPIPADTIVGMYYPFRDFLRNEYPNGVPFKNSLITDPVRQQFVWRDLAVSIVKAGHTPVWNPYSFAGTPLLANFQAAVFYPFNLFFYLLPHSIAWSWQIILSQVLLSLFLFLLLRNLKLSPMASFLGSLSFTFSGFVISWLEWNTIVHVAAWAILALLSIDKIFDSSSFSEVRLHHLSFSRSFLLSFIKRIPKTRQFWLFCFTLALIMAFLAGHLQIFFYSALLIFSYFLFRLLHFKGHKIKIFTIFAICFLIFAISTLPQSFPTLRFIFASARDVDQTQFLKAGWFIPFVNLIQFVVPDFFGNPATGNYFGVWNYAEFVGYIGLIPLFFAYFAVLSRKSRTVVFFTWVLILALLFALPNPLAKLPFIIQLPFFSSAQPTRLIFLIGFSLSVLAATGFSMFLEKREKIKIVHLFTPFYLLFAIFWAIVLLPPFKNLFDTAGWVNIARRNLILPTAILLSGSYLLHTLTKIKRKRPYFLYILLLLILVGFDLFRFARKFTPFSQKSYLFPQTEITRFLNNDSSLFRIMTLDRRIMPPDFAVYYRLQDVAGYDPLYLKSYNLLVSSWNSDKPQTTPASFNRIVTPDNPDSFITDLLNVRYFLSLTPLDSDDLIYLANEGSTYLYLNKGAFPRAWLADKKVSVKNESQALSKLFDLKKDLLTTAVIQEKIDAPIGPTAEEDSLQIVDWGTNDILIKTKVSSGKILVLSEIYYPSWKVRIDGQKGNIFPVDYLLRGVFVPSGEHTIELYSKIL